jgi:hypothetical protein
LKLVIPYLLQEDVHAVLANNVRNLAKYVGQEAESGTILFNQSITMKETFPYLLQVDVYPL